MFDSVLEFALGSEYASSSKYASVSSCNCAELELESASVSLIITTIVSFPIWNKLPDSLYTTENINMYKQTRASILFRRRNGKKKTYITTCFFYKQQFSKQLQAEIGKKTDKC